MTISTVSITEQKIIEQLTTNTGTHFLDSGGASGRNWQRNQAKDFNNEPESVVEFYQHKNEVEICITHNVFHFLKNSLEYDEKLDSVFLDYCNLPKNKNEGWLQITEKFFDHMGVMGTREGDIENPPQCINTYNGEDLLSQTLQYYLFEYRKIGEYGKHIATVDYDTQYIALQIHGGADVRGGYTRPYIYEYSEDSYPSIYDNARATIYCTYENDNRQVCMNGVEQQSNHSWYSDDGYNFYANDSEIDLKNLEATDDISKKGKGYIYINDNKQGFCPHCGELLEASF